MRNFILFKDDWKNFPTAVVHGNTRNETFLRQAEAYQRMGVNNCEFLLALLNPELADVDPFDPHLPVEIQEAIAYEAYHNPWYYHREIARIEPKGGGGTLSYLLANRSIIYFLWTTLNGLNVFMIQHRQSGKSVGSDFQSNYITHIAGYKNTIAILTKDDNLRAEQIERIKGLRDVLPAYLNPYDKRHDGDPRETLRCERWDNTITTAVPRSSEQQARNVGRGMTAPIAVIDESPFIPHIGIIVPSMLGSTSRARKIAREQGEFNYTAFITTAGDRVDKSGGYMYSIYSGGIQWDEKLFLDCPDRETLKEMIKRGRKGPMEIVCATFSHRQLGVSDAELEQLIVDNAAQGEEADRDYFNVWTNGGLSSPIPEAIKQAMMKAIEEPKYTEMDEQYAYVTRWYIPQKEVEEGIINRRIVAGMDTSEGVGNDSLTMVMVDADTGEIIGASDVNEANLFNYGLYLAKTIARFKHFVLIPERKSSGTALIDSLLVNLPKYGLDPFKVIYQTITEDFWHESKDFFAPVRQDPLSRSDTFYEVAKRYFGFVTSSAGRHSRNTLFNRVLLLAVKSTHSNTRDRKLIDQLTGLVTKGDRLDHASGKHDDLVIAYLLVFWFLTSTPHLEWYGLGGALGKCRQFEDVAEPKAKEGFDRFLDQQQLFYRKQVTDLIEQLENTSDNLIAMRIEARLDAISQRVRDTDKTGSTLDSMISAAKEKRVEVLKAKAKEAKKQRPNFGQHPSLRRW